MNISARRIRAALFPCLLGATLAWTDLAHGKVDPAETLQQGARQITLFNWDQALNLYETVLGTAEVGSAPWQEATFGAATALHHKSPVSADNLARARQLFEQLIDPKLNSRFAARAQMNLGRIAEIADFTADPVDLPAARAHYQAVIDRFPTDPIASEATLRLAGSYVQTFEPDALKQGESILRAWLESHPNDLLASAMWQYSGDAAFYRKDYRAALDNYIKADAIGFTDTGAIGSLYWRMAVMADRYLKDTDAAATYYAKIVTEAPTSGKAYEAQLALKRMGRPVPEISLFRKVKSATAPTTPTTTNTTQPAAAVGGR